jgi:Domain of unknown function (DUF4291)
MTQSRIARRLSASYRDTIRRVATESSESRRVRAVFDERRIVVYQAYPDGIADPVLAAQRFVAPFKLDRMTWIKPSFLWMMYRSGWGTKADQKRVLAITIDREGFEWALEHSSLSHFDPSVHASREEWTLQRDSSPVRIQWDPERSLNLEAQQRRAIQVGLSGEAARRYVDCWVRQIVDVTSLAREIQRLVAIGDVTAATSKLPAERLYPLPDALRIRIGAS